MSTAVVFDDAPEDLDWVRYDDTAVADWLARAPAAQPVTPLMHNSFLARLAAQADAIAAPQLPSVAAAAGAPTYATATYRGPIVAAQDRQLPVVGFERAPADVDRLMMWKAIVQYARRLAAYEIAPGTPPAGASTATVGVAGPFAESLVPQMGDAPTLEYLTEDPGTARVGPQISAGAAAYVARVAAFQAGGVAPSMVAAETAARPYFAALAAEYDTEAKTGLRYLGAFILGAYAMAYLARVQLKKVPAYRFLRMRAKQAYRAARR